MRIIAFNRFYRPDHSATSQMLTDLAEYLASDGHDVLIVTSRLRYDSGELLPRNEQLQGVNVRRIWTTRFGRANLVGRALDYLTFYISAFAAAICWGRKGDIIIAKTDPPMISVPLGWAARLKGMRLVNWCQDLFPEVAAALGVKWAKGPLGKFLKGVRNRSLRSASFNAAIDEAMVNRLTREGIPKSRIRLLPNWADEGIHAIQRDDNPVRRELGFALDTFVVGYSGNLGRAHMPERVAELVKASLDIPGIAWLFVGGGAGLSVVKQKVGDAVNVTFRPYEPRERLSISLSIPDLHLVSLDPSCEGLVLPSKLYGVLAAGRPVIGLGASEGALAREIEATGQGTCLDCEKPETWQPALTALIEGARSALKRPQLQPATQIASFAPSARLAAWRNALAAVYQ